MQNKYKHLLASVLLLCSGAVIGQTSTPVLVKDKSITLDIDLSGKTNTYIARDYVSMKPGFDYKPSATTDFSAKVDPFLTNPPTENTYYTWGPRGGGITDKSSGGVVGAVVGGANVTPTGAANYEIPIGVPKGVNGVEPSIRINYNSQSGYGLLGKGWEMGAVSSISRGARDLQYDKIADPIVHYDNSDALYLDGNRLILITGTNLTAGAIYRFEADDFTRVKIMDDGSRGTNTIYFVVTQRDGRIIKEYGKSQDSKLNCGTSSTRVGSPNVLQWRINKQSDIYNTYVQYNYSGNYLTDIEYSTASKIIVNKVVFTYSNPNVTSTSNTWVRPRKTFINGGWIVNDRLLTTISTFSGDGTIKIEDFKFDYEHDDVDTRLISVTEIASDGTKLNPTKIEWGTGSQPILGNCTMDNTSQTVEDNIFDKTSAALYMGDVNGDGYQDRIETWLGQLDAVLSSGNQTTDGYIWVKLFDPITKKYIATEKYSVPYSTWWDKTIMEPSETGNRRIIVGDINNDGFDEIITCFQHKERDRSDVLAGKSDDYYIEVLSYDWLTKTLIQKCSFFPAYSSELLAPTNMNNINGSSPVLGCKTFDLFVYDVDKDGVNDFGYAYKESLYGGAKIMGYGYVKGANDILANSTITEAKTNHWIYQSTASAGFRILKDGKLVWSDPDDFETIKISDFDGDGKLDIMGISMNKYFNETFSDASDPINYCVSTKWYDESMVEKSQVYPADFNGDGLTDIIYQNNMSLFHTDGEERRWKLCINNGGANNNVTVIDLPFFPSWSWAFGSSERHRLHPVDYNGDGLTDIVLADEEFTDGSFPKFEKTNWYFYKNLGNGNFVEETQISDQVSRAESSCRLQKMNSVVTDINGDGVPDLIFPKANNSQYSNTWNPFITDDWVYAYALESANFGFNGYSMPDASMRNVVTAITNGMGNSDRFTYTNYNKDCRDYLVFNLFDPLCPNEGCVQNLTPLPYNTVGINIPYNSDDPLTDRDTDYDVYFSHLVEFQQTTRVPWDDEPSSKNSYVLRYMRSPILIVKEHKQVDNTTTEYKFSAPITHIRGKGFLGFRHVEAKNKIKNSYSMTVSSPIPISRGQVVTSLQSINDQFIFRLYPLSIATGNYCTHSAIKPNNYVNFRTLYNYGYKDSPSPLSAVKTYDYISGTKTTEYYNDATHNLNYFKDVHQYYSNTIKTIETINKPGKVTTTEYKLYSLPSSKSFSYNDGIVPYLLTKHIVQTNDNGVRSADGKTTNYKYPEYVTNIDIASTDRIVFNEYDANGLLTKTTTDPYDVNAKTSVFKYLDKNGQMDIYGHPHTIETTANGNTRISKVEYTPSGLHENSKTNVLGETVTYDWDEIHNVLKSETDVLRNKTTTYDYNSVWQLSQINYPDGKHKSQTLQWASYNNPFDALYYAYSETSGSAPVITYYNSLGGETSKQTTGFNDRGIYTYTAYNPDGKVSYSNEPGYMTSGGRQTSYEYDQYGRQHIVNTPLGAITTDYDADGSPNFTVTSPSEKVRTEFDYAGRVVNQIKYPVIDDGKTTPRKVEFKYWPNGLVKSSTPEGGLPLNMEYNLQGNRTKLIDPDAGATTSHYNGFGELEWETDAKGITTTNIYEPSTGRLKQVNRNGEITTYIYDNLNRVQSIEIANKHKQTFTYDNLGRVTSVTEVVNGKTFVKGKEYDTYGRLKKETYPTGYFTVNNYDSYGNLTEITDKSDRSIWKLNDENALGQILSTTRGGSQTSTYEYEEQRGILTKISSPVYNEEYTFDERGNLTSRTGQSATSSEWFDYDGFNRLKYWEHNVLFNGVTIVSDGIDYNSITGNLDKKTDFGNGQFVYGEKRADGTDCGPHALTSVTGVSTLPATIPTSNLAVTYTDFKKIATLTEGNKNYAITYGVDDQRRMSVYTQDSKSITRYYQGDYEEEIDELGGVKKIHYLHGAIYINDKGVDKFYYTYSDYQGSLMALADESGNVVERYSYTPWGARRNPDAITSPDTRTSWIVNRGYTGHEHLDAFSIINMNGRVYDPVTAMFLSPDPYVQSPNDWLNYNRYSYCLNNPFKYTDPSGEVAVIDDILLGMVIAAAIYQAGATAGLHGFSTKDFLQTVVIGGVSAAATFGIGEIFGGVGSMADKSFSVLRELGRATAHGIVQGGLSVAGGGSFGSGFVSGAFSSMAGALAAGSGVKFIQTGFGHAMIASATGGITSVIAGGDFFQGAVSGLFVSLFNQGEKHGESQEEEGTPWMTAAEGELGVTEIPGKKHNTNILGYHATTGGFKNDETPWCSSFVNWSLKQAGIKGTNSAGALSWSGWGQSLSTPAYGSIAIVDYGGGKGHVGFVVGINKNGSIILLGGNQSNMVKYSAFSQSSIRGYAYPNGFKPNYTLPTLTINKSGGFNSTR